MLNKKFAIKVKIKSLAAEARIIKQAIHQTKDIATKCELRNHHILVVRKEARHSQLAYAFLRGREYSEVEAKCGAPPDFKKISELVERFGEACHYLTSGSYTSLKMRQAEQAQRFAEWKERAISYLRSSQIMP